MNDTVSDTEIKSEPVGFWAIVEIMGHQRYAGYVSEQVIAGTSLVRIDIPEVPGSQPAFTKLFGGQAIYGITPVSELAARGAAATLRKRPMDQWDLPEEWRDRIQGKQIEHHDHDLGDDEF